MKAVVTSSHFGKQLFVHPHYSISQPVVGFEKRIQNGQLLSRGCVIVKLAVRLLSAFVLLSPLFVVAAVWRIKMYIKSTNSKNIPGINVTH